MVVKYLDAFKRISLPLFPNCISLAMRAHFIENIDKTRKIHMTIAVMLPLVVDSAAPPATPVA